MKITFNDKKYNLENHEDIVPRIKDTLQHRFGVGFPKDPNGTTNEGVPKKGFPFEISIEDIGNRELILEGAKVIFKSNIRLVNFFYFFLYTLKFILNIMIQMKKKLPPRLNSDNVLD